jgi:hypothetical protein
MIDEAHIDVDGGYGESGNQTKAFLVIEGDFVNECEQYLEDEEATSIALELPRSVANALYKELGNILF